jgi:hypothetical protein
MENIILLEENQYKIRIITLESGSDEVGMLMVGE